MPLLVILDSSPSFSANLDDRIKNVDQLSLITVFTTLMH